MIPFRPARRDDVPAIIAMLQDDMLGQGREGADPAHYLAAFDAMQAEGGNTLIVGVDAGDMPIATYQLTLISGLSLRASRRAQIESVRVAASHRGQGIGAAMIRDAQQRARAAGCNLMQLTMNKSRANAHRFYEGMGFTGTHIGFKRNLD